MVNVVKKTLLALIFGAMILLPSAVFAQELSSGQGAQSFIQKQLLPECLRLADKARTQGGQCVLDSITHFTNLLLFVIAVAAFFYLLYGAFLYASAFGEETKVAQAKKTITYALVGVMLAGVSSLLVQIVRTLLRA